MNRTYRFDASQKGTIPVIGTPAVVSSENVTTGGLAM